MRNYLKHMCAQVCFCIHARHEVGFPLLFNIFLRSHHIDTEKHTNNSQRAIIIIFCNVTPSTSTNIFEMCSETHINRNEDTRRRFQFTDDIFFCVPCYLVKLISVWVRRLFQLGRLIFMFFFV